MSPHQSPFPEPGDRRRAELEDRLRSALAARADDVTPQSLHPARPPAPARRLARWAIPTLGAVAVAAASAGIYVGVRPDVPASTAAPAARPTSTADPSPPTPSTPPTSSTPSSRPASGWVVVTAAGWQVRVPSDWGKSSLSTDPDADSACLGPAKGDPCLVRLVAGRNPGNLPYSRKLGGGLVQDYARLDCRAGDASETTIEGATGSAGVIGLRCGSRRYEQVWLWSRNLLAVGRTDGADGADLVGKVLAGLAVDRSYPAMRTLDCPDVALAARSDKTVTGLAATGASCAEATALVRAVDPRLSVITGPSKIAVKGYTCSVTLDTVSVLPAADLTCRRDDGGATVTYRQG